MFTRMNNFFWNSIRSDEGPISLETSALKDFHVLILALINLFDTNLLRRYTFIESVVFIGFVDLC